MSWVYDLLGRSSVSILERCVQNLLLTPVSFFFLLARIILARLRRLGAIVLSLDHEKVLMR